MPRDRVAKRSKMEGRVTRQLVECFQQNLGRRGVTFYNGEHCNFLPWNEVFKFLDSFPSKSNVDPFSERLADTLANYNPDCEFLAVQQNGDSVSVELYSQPT
jgi:hypothetical protein